MPDTILKSISAWKYRFDFASDEMLYSVSFEGNILPEEIRNMLETVQIHPYRSMAGAIRTYLLQHCLKHSGFVSCEIPADPDKTTESADSILHSGTCNILDRLSRNADFYYAAADCRQHGPEHQCRGCYLAARKLPSDTGTPEYHVIGQTFSSDIPDFDEHGYFAIRKGKNGRMYDLERSEGESVLPSLGCVDVVGLLLHIETVRTRKQAKKTAARYFP